MQIGKILPYNFKSSYKNYIESESKYTKYPNDLEYIRKLAFECGLGESALRRLTSIIGEEELTDILKNAQNASFIPPKIIRGKLEPSVFENFDKFDYSINLHIHTTASDGIMSPVELIEQAALYADKLKKMGHNSFTVAITDHDTMEGNKEVIYEVLKHPEKYKNLKIVLGVELSALYRDPDKMNVPTDYELIAYCVNPYDCKSSEYLSRLRDKRISFAQYLAENAARSYPSFNISYSDACEFSLNPKKGINGFLYSLAAYFKMKVPFIDRYRYALRFLPINFVQEPELLYEAHEISDAFSENSGFFGIAHPGRINLSDGRIKDSYIKKCDNENKNAGYEIIGDFIKRLKDAFGSRFRAIETKYQSYDNDLLHAHNILQGQEVFSDRYKESVDYLLNFKKIASENDLLETGGLDTHSENPFVRK